MVDGFPLSAVDPDREKQLMIDSDLQNCRQRTDEFEQAFPEDPAANVRTLLDRVLNRPKPAALYPALLAGKDGQAWVMPLLRRLAWNDRNARQGASWPRILADMLEHAMTRVVRVNEAEFIALTDQLEIRILRYEREMGNLARQLEKSGPLSARVIEAITKLHHLSDRRNVTISERSSLVWSLFRCESGLDAPESSWSRRVHSDLMSLEPKHRAQWMSVLADAPAICREQPGRPWLAAVKHLGNAELEDGLLRWTGMLDDEPSLNFTPVDAIVLQHVIAICDHLGGPGCDQLLYDIARAPWAQKPAHAWMHNYLFAIDRRPQDRAFACLEALMMNPVTALPDVRRRYEALLAVFGTTALAESTVGVDGYPLDSDASLSPHQKRIDQLLRMAASAASAGPYKDPGVAANLAMLRAAKTGKLHPAQQAALQKWEEQMARPLPWFPVAPEVTAAHDAMEAAIFQEFQADAFGVYRAVNVRSEWIAAHQGDYLKDTVRLWNEWLARVRRQAFTRIDDLPLEWLLTAIWKDSGSAKLLELCQKYVARQGWDANLLLAFRQWIPKIGTAAGDHMLRAQAEWFAWFENITPIDLDACWSNRVKQSIREMATKEAAAWSAMLENNTFIITGKPPMKWLKAGAGLFPKVGAAAFRLRFLEWFAPFRKGEALRLTITGRNILRTLMWYALIAQDPMVDDALLGFARVKWKNKETSKRAAQAEMAFAYVISEREPESALPILEPLVASGHAFAGSTTHRVYMALCARWNREPVQAIRAESKPHKSPAPNPILDNLTIGEFRAIMQRKP